MTSTDNDFVVPEVPVRAPRRSFIDTLLALGAFERLVVAILLTIIVVSGTSLLYSKNKETLVEVPRSGGKHIEGIVGTPRFINPLLAISQADKDLTGLVYAGLMTRDGNGTLVPELAEHYEISEDGTQYTFVLRENLIFHDETPLTADDVIFTVTQAANPSVRSTVFADWDGVQVEKIDDRTIIFTLPEPYAPFIENTTIGILPAHIWSRLSAEEFPVSQFNITPVGAGPYKIGLNDVLRDKSGIASGYRLTKFDEYALGEPYIHTLEFVLFSNTDDAITAYTSQEVNAINGISPSQLDALLTSPTLPKTAIHRTPLLRVFGIFFNHNKQPIFLKDGVREALEIATPKRAVVGEVLRGYGTVLDSPLPSFITNIGEQEKNLDNTSESEKEHATEETSSSVPINNVERARILLEEAGWKRGEDGVYAIEEDEVVQRLSFSLSTASTPELTHATQKIVDSWRDVGMEIELKTFEPTDLTQTVIRPRRFDALFFGMVLGHELDLYAFWHSSQRNDPGLNIAQYADIEADALLEKMRTETSADARKELYATFSELLKEQHVAIFLYAPDFVYVVNDSVHLVSLHPSKEPSERFDTVHLWHVETDTVWPFVKDILGR